MRLYLSFFLIVFYILFSAQSFAKGLMRSIILPSDSLIKRYDTSFVNPLPNTISLRYYLNLKQNALDFNVNGDDAIRRYEVKNQLRYGFGFGYRWLIANGAYHFNPEKDIKKYDFQINVNGKRFLYDIRTQWYKGYKLKGNDFRKDIELVSVGGSLRYNFKHKIYSFKSSFDQTQWQLKSAGTPIAGINYSYLKLKSDSLFNLGVNSDITTLSHETFNVGFGGGYAHTFVRNKHWFLTVSLLVYLDAKINSDIPIKQNLKINPEPRIAFGYNSSKYWVGLTGTFHQFPGQLSDDVYLNYNYNNIKLLFVHRLNFNPYK